jgi:hypothetical protein
MNKATSEASMSYFIYELYSGVPSNQYVAAYKSITSYVLLVALTDAPQSSSPTQKELEAYLINLKTTSWGWLNDTATQVKALPSYMLALLPLMETSLTSLKTLKSNTENPTAKAEIIQIAQLLLHETCPLHLSIQSLRSKLSALSITLMSTSDNLQHCMTQLQADVRNLQGELAKSSALCHAAECSASPDQNKIQQLQRDIAQLQNDIGVANDWELILVRVKQNMVDAEMSAQYLDTSWQGFLDEVGHVVAILQLIQKNPVVLKEIPLKNANQSLQAVENYMSNIAKDIDQPSNRENDIEMQRQ